MSNVIQYESSDSLLCRFCNESFEEGQLRHHTLTLRLGAKPELVMLHADGCLDKHRNQERWSVAQRVRPPKWLSDAPTGPQLVDWLDRRFSEAVKLCASYPGSVVWPASQVSGAFWLDLPIAPQTQIKALDNRLLKSLFAVVCVLELRLTGPTEDYWQRVSVAAKKLLQGQRHAAWMWCHQVQGTNDSWRLVYAMQASEDDLLRLKRPETWQELEMDFKSDWSKQRDVICEQMGAVSQKLEAVLEQEAPRGFKSEMLDLQHMMQATPVPVQGQSRFRVNHNCQNSVNNVKEFYILPHPDSQSTQLLSYLGKTADPIPLFYDKLTDTEKELDSNRQLCKQSLTNYRLLVVYYPRALVQ